MTTLKSFTRLILEGHVRKLEFHEFKTEYLRYDTVMYPREFYYEKYGHYINQYRHTTKSQ